MWLFTELGFFSIVKKAPNCWHLRARLRSDLENIVSLHLPGKIEVLDSYPGSDYPFRIILDRRQKAALFARLSKIDYSNFKARVAARPDQQDRGPLYHHVWETMREIEVVPEDDFIDSPGGALEYRRYICSNCGFRLPYTSRLDEFVRRHSELHSRHGTECVRKGP